jgi:hypothetical protein
MSIKRIREAVQQERYEFTMHALEEMDEDGLTEAEVRRALLNGELRARLTDDPRGIRFVVRGTSIDVEIETVCRFLPSGLMRIITVYVPEELLSE